MKDPKRWIIDHYYLRGLMGKSANEPDLEQMYSTMAANIKPLITCQECGKWHTMDCPHKQIAIRNSIVVNPGYEVCWTDADDFCKEGTSKEPR